jgi:hypothetical protein
MSSVLRFPAIVGKGVQGRPPLAVEARSGHHEALTAFRPAAVGRPTAGADPLLVEAVATAFESLRLLESRAGTVAREFRRLHFEEARDGLVDLIHATQIFVELATAAAQAAFGVEADADDDTEQASEAMRCALGEIIASQRTADSAAMVRALEHRFVSALADWRLVLERIDDQSGGPDPFGHAA